MSLGCGYPVMLMRSHTHPRLRRVGAGSSPTCRARRANRGRAPRSLSCVGVELLRVSENMDLKLSKS
eukprot:5787846-Prymnesium_polylepis.1